jgi:predicted NBD/HSP70 family sugar kinase
MGWATVVKVINQLTETGLVTERGTTDGPLRSRAVLYGLRGDRPLCIGVDIEYGTTRVVLTNLAGDVLGEDAESTPATPSADDTFAFFESLLSRFCERRDVGYRDLAGIGIGLPGIGFPLPSRKENEELARELEARLSRHFETLVRVGTNTHAYATFEKWSNETFASGDFILVSIRAGVGTGIFHGGRLYTGAHGLAGEMGHMKVGHRVRCRCGAVGCLEAVTNQGYLARRYAAEVMHNENWCPNGEPACLHAGLSDLFSRAGDGEPAARAIVEETAGYLAHALAHAVITLDITNLIVSGHFGPDGEAIVEPMKEMMARVLLPDMTFELRYVPLDPRGHTMGAALLALRDFFVDIPEV